MPDLEIPPVYLRFRVPGDAELAARAAEDKRRAELWRKAMHVAEGYARFHDRGDGSHCQCEICCECRDVLAAERGEKKGENQ